MPVPAGRVILVGACDGQTYTVNKVALRERGWVSAWVQGLPENCDRDNVRVTLDEKRLAIDFVGAQDSGGNRQVNAVVPGNTTAGEHSLRIECAGVSSEPLSITVVAS